MGYYILFHDIAKNTGPYCIRIAQEEKYLLSFYQLHPQYAKVLSMPYLKHGYIHIFPLYESCSFYGLWPLWNSKEGTITFDYYVTDVPSNDRRGYGGADLRDKLGRQRSPPRRNSFDRDARDQLPSRGHSSPPRSGKKSDWTHKKRQHFDGESDGSLRIPDGAERQARDRKPPSSEFKDVDDEQLKQVQSEIDMLEDHKLQLQIYLEERVQEGDSLNSKIKELEIQLSTEKEECKRISSKIRKFDKANHRHSRIQDELKRSQARFQRLGDQLGSDARAAVNEEDISINILSDEETLDNHSVSPKNDKASPSTERTFGNNPPKDQYKASPSKKRSRVHMVEDDENLKRVSSSAKREWLSTRKMRSERHSGWDGHLAQMKNTKEIRAKTNGINNGRPLVDDGKPMRRKSNFTSIPSADKGPNLQLALPATRMAAKVMDEKLEAEEIASAVDNTPPPPPPVLPNAYLQYKGKDENVDVDDDDADEMLDVDIV